MVRDLLVISSAQAAEESLDNLTEEEDFVSGLSVAPAEAAAVEPADHTAAAVEMAADPILG